MFAPNAEQQRRLSPVQEISKATPPCACKLCTKDRCHTQPSRRWIYDVQQPLFCKLPAQAEAEQAAAATCAVQARGEVGVQEGAASNAPWKLSRQGRGWKSTEH